jgi:hypothetical protein
MVDYSYVECSSSCIKALLKFKEEYPNHRAKEIEYVGGRRRGGEEERRRGRRDKGSGRGRRNGGGRRRKGEEGEGRRKKGEEGYEEGRGILTTGQKRLS